MDNRFVIDWLTFTTKIDSLDSIITSLGLEHITFLTTNGFYGYRESLYFNGVRIHFGGFKDDMGICVEMSGTGCRTFETYSTVGFNAVFDMILDANYNITRLDVAYDDFSDVIPLVELLDDVRNKNYVSRFSTFFISESITDKGTGLTVELGSKTSEIMFRFYDKYAEQMSKGNEVSATSWVRAEMQLRGDRALSFIKLYNGDNLGDLWCGVLLNYFRVIIPGTNAVKSRCTVADYWKNLINNAVKVKLFTPTELEYNVSHLEKFVVRQAGGAVSTYAQIMGSDAMLDKITHTPRMENKKYTRLLHDHQESMRLVNSAQKAVSAPAPKPAPAPKKQRTEYPNFTLSESILVQMEFDVDVLSADFLTGYKPYKY